MGHFPSVYFSVQGFSALYGSQNKKETLSEFLFSGHGNVDAVYACMDLIWKDSSSINVQVSGAMDYGPIDLGQWMLT